MEKYKVILEIEVETNGDAFDAMEIAKRMDSGKCLSVSAEIIGSKYGPWPHFETSSLDQ